MARKILCVDDDPHVLDLTVEYLERLLDDVTIHTAASAAAGREVWEQRALDCIVSDYRMPEMDGIEVLDRVRDRHPDLPFVLFTSEGSEDIASEAICAGVTDYVQKGEQYEILANRIDNAIDRYHSQTAYRELFETIDDAIIVHDPETGEILDVNRAVCDYWGYSYERAREATLEELSASSQWDSEREARELIQRTVEEGPQRVEWRCETSDGAEFWADVRLGQATLNGRDRVVAVIRDVTEEKRREQELESFREAVEQAGHSIYITDRNARIEYVNPAFERITGYSAEEAVGRTPRLLKSGEHGEEFYQELWSTILNGEVWHNEIVNRRKNGDRYVVNQTIAPIVDEAGDVVRFVAVNADITEQKRRERQLQTLYQATTEWLDAESREEVCRLVSTQLTELLEFDLHGVCLYDDSTQSLEPALISDRVAALDEIPACDDEHGIVRQVFETGEYEYRTHVRVEPDGGHLHDGDGSDHSPEDGGADVGSDDPQEVVRSELVLPLGSHGVLWIGSTRSDAFTDSDETLAKVLTSVLAEVLDRIEREQELQAQNSRLQEFASVVSHDLRNPLSIAHGHLELALDTGDNAHLEEVQEAHERMDRIIDDLLWLAREGRGIGEQRQVDLEHVLEEAWAHVDTADATLSAACDRTVAADPDRLQQLFENLFRNAVEHAGPDVEVRAGLLENGFYVEDDGPGIPPDERERIRKAGYTTAESGTGLGLSIVTRIVEAHEWYLTVTESAEGGARFEITGVEKTPR